MPARLQLDTASDITIISEEIWKQIGRSNITRTNRVTTNAKGGTLCLIGELSCSVQFEKQESNGVCRVARHHNLNLLGLGEYCSGGGSMCWSMIGQWSSKSVDGWVSSV